MAFDVNAQAGPRLISDGAQSVVRSAKTGELIVSTAHGDYYEAASRGNIYWVSNQTGVTTQAGLSATTPALILANPANSGINVALLLVNVTFTVAFAAAAIVWLAANVNPVAAAVTGTDAPPINGLLSNTKRSSAKAFTAGTLPAVPVAIDVIGVGLTGAITTIPQIQAFFKEYKGAVVLGPNSAISIQTSTASGASAAFCSYVWEEIPIQ